MSGITPLRPRLPLKPQREIPQPRRIASESEAVHEARLLAIARLGANWLLHPDYQPTPRHAIVPDLWKPARKEYLAGIAARAAADRARNPAFQRNEGVRKALG